MFIQGVCLLFFKDVPGTMFIPGATSIPDSREGGFDLGPKMFKVH